MTEEQAMDTAKYAEKLLENCIEEASLDLKVKLLRYKIMQSELLLHISKKVREQRSNNGLFGLGL